MLYGGKLEQQKNCLDNYQKFSKGHATYQVYCQTVMGRNNDLYKDSESYRARQEGAKLCDLGCTLMEKYGPYRGWKLGLRNEFEDKAIKHKKLPNCDKSGMKEGNVVEDRVDVGRGGISAMMTDDRNARIDLVRKTLVTPQPVLGEKHLIKAKDYIEKMHYRGKNLTPAATRIQATEIDLTTSDLTFNEPMSSLGT